jgi:hypothetical protein
VIIGLLAYFTVPIFARSFREFNPAEWEINYWLLAASLLLMQVVLWCQSAIWSKLIGLFNRKLGYWKAFKIAYLGQLGRYIPGKVWQLLAVTYLAKKEGVRVEEATAGFILSQVFATPPGLLIVVTYLFIAQAGGAYREYSTFGWAALLAIAVFLVIFLQPNLFKSMLNFGLTRLARQPEVEFRLEKKVGIEVLFYYFLTWNFYGLCFYLFLISILPGYEFSLVETIGAWTLAYLVGYWTIILPAGIGAREAALILLLAPIIGPERAGIVVVGARLWSLTGEALCTLLAWSVK